MHRLIQMVLLDSINENKIQLIFKRLQRHPHRLMGIYILLLPFMSTGIDLASFDSLRDLPFGKDSKQPALLLTLPERLYLLQHDHGDQIPKRKGLTTKLPIRREL